MALASSCSTSGKRGISRKIEGEFVDKLLLCFSFRALSATIWRSIHRRACSCVAILGNAACFSAFHGYMQTGFIREQLSLGASTGIS